MTFANSLEDERRYMKEIRSLAQWKEDVIAAPVPVVLCCFAPWCPVSNDTVQLLNSEVRSGCGKWHLVLLNVDDHTDLKSALKLTQVPTLFLIDSGHTLLNLVLDAVQLRSGLVTTAEVAVTRLNRAFADLEKGLYDAAIEKYTSLLETTEEKYELTCLVALIKAHVWKKNYATAEQYYNTLMSKYHQEADTVAEVRAVCQLLENTFSGYIQDKARKERYTSIKEGLLQENEEQPFGSDIALKLASLDFDFGFYGKAFDQVLSVIEDEGTLQATGFTVFKEMTDALGAENDYVQAARKKLERLIVKLNIQ